MTQPADREATMRIGWIGGVERNEHDLVRMARTAGHHLTFHSGHMAGRGSQDLKNLVDRSDLVIILTDVNSHGAVIAARRMVREHGRASMVVRRLGAARFQALLDALDTARPLLKTGS
jgi:uncharacterized protein DUF2325